LDPQLASPVAPRAVAIETPPTPREVGLIGHLDMPSRRGSDLIHMPESIGARGDAEFGHRPSPNVGGLSRSR